MFIKKLNGFRCVVCMRTKLDGPGMDPGWTRDGPGIDPGGNRDRSWGNRDRAELYHGWTLDGHNTFISYNIIFKKNNI